MLLQFLPYRLRSNVTTFKFFVYVCEIFFILLCVFLLSFLWRLGKTFIVFQRRKRMQRVFKGIDINMSIPRISINKILQIVFSIMSFCLFLKLEIDSLIPYTFDIGNIDYKSDSYMVSVIRSETRCTMVFFLICVLIWSVFLLYRYYFITHHAKSNIRRNILETYFLRIVLLLFFEVVFIYIVFLHKKYKLTDDIYFLLRDLLLLICGTTMVEDLLNTYLFWPVVYRIHIFMKRNFSRMRVRKKYYE